MDALREERYEPDGKCPFCEHRLTNGEIITGFNRDPNDYTTKCPMCKKRFEPKLVYAPMGGLRFELAFYCPTQVLARMENEAGLLVMHPAEIKREHPAVYHSAVAHHGSLKAAFKKIGREYRFVERDQKDDWRGKVVPFLGRMPDTVIADCAEISVGFVRQLRRQMKIARYRARDHVDN